MARSIFQSAILLALVLGSAAASASAAYDVDTDHDGRTDHTLELEQSDSLA
jgi:hypothetical protein